MQIALNPLSIVKGTTTFVVGAGTTAIVKGIIENNTDPEAARDKVAIAAAGFVIGSMAANATKDYTDRSIDEIVETYHQLKAIINRTKPVVPSTVVE
jgi:4-hydroxybenzoate polyprenyltransferase